MVRKNRRSDEEGQTAVDQTTGQPEGAQTEAQTVSSEAPSEAPASAENGQRKTKDMSNPPFYVLMGTNNASGAGETLAQEPTIRRMAKTYAAIRGLVSRHYSNIHVLRVKRLELSELNRPAIKRQRKNGNG